MNNFYTYTLNLRDRLSSPLRRAGSSVVEATRRLRDMRREAQNLNNVEFTGFSRGLKNALSNIPFANILANPFVVAGAVAGRAIKLGIDQEMQKASFEVLFGGETQAKKMIDSISDYAAKTSYGKDGLGAAVQTMAGFGIAQERIMPNLKAIGEIAMGNKGRFDSLTLAFSQMSSVGTLMGQDLNQMINAGFNPLMQISKDTGKSVGQLKEEMGKGKITADMVASAFQKATQEGGQFYGMSEKMGATFGGQLSLAMTNINNKLLDLYNILEPLLMPAVRAFNLLLTDSVTFFNKLGERINQLSTPVKIFGGLMVWLGTTILTYKAIMGVVTLATKAWAFAQGILNTVLTLNPVGLIIAGIVALIALIGFLIVKVDGWGDAWQHTINGCKLVFKAYVDSVKFYFTTMLDGLMIGLNKIKEGWYQFKEAVGIGDSSENQRMLADIHADTEARKKSIIDGAKGIAQTSKDAMSEFKKAGSSLKFNDVSLGDVVGKLQSKLGIAPAGVAGMDSGGSTGGGLGSSGGGTGTGGAGGKTANSIATGGSKTTHITINLGSLVQTMNVTAGNVKESAEKVRDIVLDEMSRALTMAQANV